MDHDSESTITRVKRLLQGMNDSPTLSSAVHFAEAHPRLAAWLCLSTAVGIILALGGRAAELPLRSWLSLFTAACLTSAACVSIVSGGRGDHEQPGNAMQADIKQPDGNLPKA